MYMWRMVNKHTQLLCNVWARLRLGSVVASYRYLIAKIWKCFPALKSGPVFPLKWLGKLFVLITRYTPSFPAWGVCFLGISSFTHSDVSTPITAYITGADLMHTALSFTPNVLKSQCNHSMQLHVQSKTLMLTSKSKNGLASRYLQGRPVRWFQWSRECSR